MYHILIVHRGENVAWLDENLAWHCLDTAKLRAALDELRGWWGYTHPSGSPLGLPHVGERSYVYLPALSSRPPRRRWVLPGLAWVRRLPGQRLHPHPEATPSKSTDATQPTPPLP